MRNLNAFIFVTLLIFSSCKEKEDTNHSDEARELFSLSAELIQSISREIAVASDSSSVDSLSKVFEKKITDINFMVPPQTDLKLTEQENDSLFKLMKLMKTISQEKLSSLAVIESPDSITE